MTRKSRIKFGVAAAAAPFVLACALCAGPLSAADSREYLRRLCAALVTGGRDSDGVPTAVHPYLLPHEAVLASRRNGTKVSEEIRKLSEADDRRNVGFSSTRGPVPAAPRNKPKCASMSARVSTAPAPRC